MTSLLHRLFGLGALPGAMRSVLEQEGIELLVEGVGGSITLRSFRAPGRRSFFHRSWFVGSMVITGQRIAAFAYSRPVLNVALDHEKLEELEATVEGAKLCIRFDAAAFDEKQSGTVELRFSTSRAPLFLDRLERA